MMGSDNFAPPRNVISNVGRALFFALIISMFLLPGCKFGGNPASPDSGAPGVSPEPFTPNQPGTPLDDPRTAGQSPGLDNNSSVPYLELIGPEEIINYEYPRKMTVLQSPEFRVKLHNFSGNADSSMFVCFIDGEKALPSYAPAEKVVSFSPDNLLADGMHNAAVAFTGGTHLVSTGLPFSVCTKPPKITDVMHQPNKGNFIVCFNRQIESKYALNPDNWEINSNPGIFSSAKMDPHSGCTRVILKIASKESLPDIGPGGYKIGFYSIQGFTDGLISPMPLWGWGNHAGESDGVGLRTGQSGDCEDCEAIKIGAEHWKHVSKQTEHHRIAYEVEENPDFCPILIIASYQFSVIANEPFHDARDPQGSFWKDEDTWIYGDSGGMTFTYSVNPAPGCRTHMYGGSETITGLVYDFYALCGVDPDWVHIDSINFGIFQADIGNPYFYETPQIMTGPETAIWLEDSKNAFNPEQVHATEFWAYLIPYLESHECDYFVTGATYDLHANSGNNAWAVDVLQSDGSYFMPFNLFVWPPLLVIDDYDLYYDEKYPWVGMDCSGSERDEDGFWIYEIWYGYIPMVDYAPPDPPLGVRLRATDCWGNWKRSDNLMDLFTGSWDVDKFTFYKYISGLPVELSFCDSPLLERGQSGHCTLNIAAHVVTSGTVYPPSCIRTYISNETDIHYPPACLHGLELPLYRVTRGSPTYIYMMLLFNVASNCNNEFYSRGDNLEYGGLDITSPPLVAADDIKTSENLLPWMYYEQPYLWVSHREFTAWFPDNWQDSTNVFSCDHISPDPGTPPLLKSSEPVFFGADKGIYRKDCSSVKGSYGTYERHNWIPDLYLGGFAFINAEELSSSKEANIGVQAEADLVFINAHFQAGDANRPPVGFSTFAAGVYPGSCSSTDNHFFWHDIPQDALKSDCNWIATTGCESLADHPYGLHEARQTISDNDLESIAGFKEMCLKDIYDQIPTYSQKLNEYDGDCNNSLWWHVPPQEQRDRNIVAWMETFCLACRDENVGRQASFARAIDGTYTYNIDKGKKWYHFKKYWFIYY